MWGSSQAEVHAPDSKLVEAPSAQDGTAGSLSEYSSCACACRLPAGPEEGDQRVVEDVGEGHSLYWTRR